MSLHGFRRALCLYGPLHAIASTQLPECLVLVPFDDYDLNVNLLRGTYSYGFEKPSAIQQRGILLRAWRGKRYRHSAVASSEGVTVTDAEEYLVLAT